MEPGSHGFDVPRKSTVVKEMGQRLEKDSAEAGGSLRWRLAWSTLGVLGEILTQRKINNNKKRQDCRVVAVAYALERLELNPL